MGVFKSESDACSLLKHSSSKQNCILYPYFIRVEGQLLQSLITDLYKSFYKTENAKETLSKILTVQKFIIIIYFLRPVIQAPP